MKPAIFLAAALALVPAIGSAATYHYVDTSGTVRSVEADSAAEAFARADGIAANSGVALDLTGDIDNGEHVLGVSTETDYNAGAVLGASTDNGWASMDGGLVLGAATDGDNENYHYVDQSGVVRTVSAPSAYAAFSVATNIDEHSGVKLDLGQLDAGEVVPVD
jgi:hypothetical protein